MAAAVLALLGALVSAYLLLFKLGVVGRLACGVAGGCEQVQASRWSVLLGVPVAAYGVFGYLALLAIALYGLQPDELARPRATRWLAVLSALGVLFSLYLAGIELFAIRAICRWCTASGVIIVALCVVSLAGLLASRRGPAR
jgi:uncharacterized membrane protein